MKTGKLFLLGAMLLLPGTFCICQAQLKLAQVFADHMVLQRQKKVPVWGTAKAGDKVTVSYNSNSAVAIADASGSWLAYLHPMEAQAEGKDMTVTAGGQHVVLHDVLVGEVWLCSGQSNMRMELMFRDAAIPGVVDWENEVKKANYPLIRFYNRFRGKGASLWEACDSNSVKLFSAVAYYFGAEIYKELNVPIGLIHQSAGGTSIQKWIPERYFEQLPWSKQYLDFSQYVPWLEPASCYNNFIAPLAGYGIRGVLWYQGESNANFNVHGYSYRYLLPLLITSWRKEWKQDDLPFAFVQLPLFNNSNAFRYIREAQLNTLKTIPNTGMVTSYDEDEFRTMLHPRNKKHVGERLAIWARSTVYGRKELEAMGPVYQSYEKTGNVIKVQFNRDIQSGDGKELKGFMIAGANKEFQPAVAVITGKNAVSVSNTSVTAPLAVRYTWGENIDPGNLTGTTGLPASPFRTDDWGNDTLETALQKGQELHLVKMTDHWSADAKAINDWMPATQPARTDLKNNTVILSTNRNGRGGVQSPFLMSVDLSRHPVIKLNNLKLESAQGWSLMLMTPGKEQYIIKDMSAESGNVVVDVVNGIQQNKQKKTGSINLQGTNDIVLLFYAVSDQRRGVLSLDSIELEYKSNN